MAEQAQVVVKSATAYVDFIEFKGDSLDMDFTWADENDANVDFTAYTARMQVRASPIDPVVLLTKTEGSGITLGAAESNIFVEITREDTIALGVGGFVYDIELTAPNGKANTFFSGKLVLNPSVTQPA